MKNIFKIFAKKQKLNTISVKVDQEAILEFINDTENIRKAAHGSMEKRLKLIERASHAQTV